jgi:hypothetical protein
MVYDKDDFRRCQFNPLDKNILKNNPRLQDLIGAYPDEDYPAPKESILRYILALYDPASPLVKDYPDLGSRKMAAAQVADFNLSDESLLKTVFECDNEAVASTIIGFLRDFAQNRLWAMYCSNEQTFWEYNLRLLTSISAEKDRDLMAAVSTKTKLSDDMEAISNRLERLQNTLYGDDEHLKKKAKRGRFTAEDMAGIS